MTASDGSGSRSRSVTGRATDRATPCAPDARGAYTAASEGSGPWLASPSWPGRVLRVASLCEGGLLETTMATSTGRMRALRERERRGLRRFTIGVSKDGLRVIAEHGYEGADGCGHSRE